MLEEYNSTFMFAYNTVLLLCGKNSEALEISSLISVTWQYTLLQQQEFGSQRRKANHLVSGRGGRIDAVSRIPYIEAPD